MRSSPLVWLLAIAALLIRAVPVLLDGAWRYPVDYDEGVYFSSSALLFQGVWPWQQFAMVHPPGVLLALAPASALTGWLGPYTSFALARMLAAIAGGLTTFVLGRTGVRFLGPVGGITAALLYACYPEAVLTERGAFIEPWLNLALVLGVSQVLRRRFFVAGVCFGLALTCKLWAVLWLPGVLVAWWLLPGRSFGGLLRGGGGLVLAAAVVLLPFVLLAPDALFHQVVGMQLGRPPDGMQGATHRLGEMFHARHLAASVFAGLSVFAWRSFRAELALFLVPFVLTVAAFCVSPTYWSQYNGHLALSHCALAGVGAAMLELWKPDWSKGLLALALLGCAPSVRSLVKFHPQPTDALLTLRQTLASTQGCAFAFEPSWLLVAGRLPEKPLVVDSYGAMLSAALPGAYRDTAEAMRSERAQTFIREAMRACPNAVIGWRGRWQLDETWLRASYAETATSGIDVWTRKP